MSIRMPSAGRSFFPFVRNSPEAVESLIVFPTYAHLVTTGAGYAAVNDLFSEEPELLDADPLPIEVDTFRRQDLYEPLLAFVVAHTGSVKAVGNETEFRKTVEGLADAGLKAMRSMLEESTAAYWPAAWSAHLRHLVEDGMTGPQNDSV